MSRLSRRALAALGGLVVLTTAAALSLGPTHTQAQSAEGSTATQSSETETAIFAGGCFWCVEKDFDHVEGVLSTTSGYIGGRLDNPTYQTHVGAGDREAVEVVFDPSVVSYEALTEIFFRTVNPLDDGGQFCDRGHSYTTAIYTLSDDQREIATAAASAASEALGEEIATPIIDAPQFWPAEDYHQDYYLKNPFRYQFYRASCRRDRTVERVWGEQAYLGVDH